MSFYFRNKMEFNGYLHSLRYICDTIGFEEFCQENECDLYRTKLLYYSDIHGSNYILSLLWSDKFDEDLEKLLLQNKNTIHRRQKYEEDVRMLSSQLLTAEKSFCGIGLYKVYQKLDHLSEFDFNAKLMRLILRIENANVKAKICSKEYREQYYNIKTNSILQLIKLCDENNIDYGFISSDVPSTESLVFFDLPCGQVSWHTIISKDNYKIYKKDWDGKRNSTFSKIEKFVYNNFIFFF